MTYTLARVRALRPEAPFTLGGRFTGDADRPSLTDALGGLALAGASKLWIDLRDGDLVELSVTTLDQSTATVAAVEVVRRAGPGFRLPRRPRAADFTKFVRAVRTFLIARGLSEVFSPSLVVCPGLEPSLEAFGTEITRGTRARVAYLPTSPEINLKKALASGWTDLFEIKPCFRRGESSDHHANEFLMLEWYRGFADLDLIEADLRAMFVALADSGLIEGEPVVTTDFAAVFGELFDFVLTPATSRAELIALAVRVKVETRADDSFADVFNRLMVDRVEPWLETRGPTVVRRFPPSMAALAKLDPNGWGDRFELYWRGLEIANAFNEVDDFEEQARRWQNDLAERARLGTAPLPIDGELIVALRAGSPPAGGIALGMERLFMAGNRVARIAELRAFDELSV